MATKTKRASLGDIVELQTPKGFAYAQYVHNHQKPPCFGALVRILPGLFDKPQDATQLGNVEEDLYCCFWPISNGVKQGDATIVGRGPIPKKHRKLPHFKAGTRSLRTGRMSNWRIWDGKSRKDKHVARLTKAQCAFPMLEIVCTPDLTDRIASGWMPAHECANVPVPPSMLPAPKTPAPTTKRPTAHVELLDNDAAAAFFGVVAEDGLSNVRHALAYMKRAAAREPLERDDANIVLAIAVLCLAKQGVTFREAVNTAGLKDAVNKCRAAISRTMLSDVAALVEQVLNDSELSHVRSSYDGAFGFVGSLGGSIHRIVSEDFLALLTEAELRNVELQPTSWKGRKKFFEIVGPEGPSFVAVTGLDITGWRCTECGHRTYGYWIEDLAMNSFVAQSDLPASLPGVFTVGKWPEIELAVTGNRWKELVGRKGTRGRVSQLLGVAPDQEVVRRPELPTYE